MLEVRRTVNCVLPVPVINAGEKLQAKPGGSPALHRNAADPLQFPSAETAIVMDAAPFDPMRIRLSCSCRLKSEPVE